jgi:hypothetical protein
MCNNLREPTEHRSFLQLEVMLLVVGVTVTHTKLPKHTVAVIEPQHCKQVAATAQASLAAL